MADLDHLDAIDLRLSHERARVDVTVEIGSGGSTVMVEPELRKGLTRRVFRRMLDGSLEWAAYDDWRTHNERARFFGFASRDLPSSMTS